MLRLFAIFTMLLLTSIASAQTPPASNGGAKPAPKGTGKPNPLDQIDGYTRYLIEGFTVMIHKDTLDANTTMFERKPLEVLELELGTVVKMSIPKAADALRKVLIWADWDDKPAMGNGRAGSALATYYGGHQLQAMRQGMHPLRAKAITVHSTRSLTREHQPKTDSGRCVLLHELAHAVHDQYVGFENPQVMAVYKQAMERKLYDKTLYVATNEAEFFAELSCAYFDQLDHYPRTRDDLKKHDPTSHKYLESVWGKGTRPTTAFGEKLRLAATNGADKFDLEIKRSAIKFGPKFSGEDFTPEDLDGKITVVGCWGGKETAVLSKLVAIHNELSAYGVRVIAASSFVGNPDTMKRDLDARDVQFATVTGLFIPAKGEDTPRQSEKAPHTLIFDAEQACVFRGSGYDAMPHARAAVGRAMIAGLVPGDVPKGLVGSVSALTTGQPLLDTLPKLTAAMASGDTETATAAKALHAALIAPGVAQLDKAKKGAKADPVGSFLLAEPLPKLYKGTSIEARANVLLIELKQTTAVGTEIKARVLLDQVKKFDAALSGQSGSFNPADPVFQGENAAALNQLQAILGQLKKQYPTAKATDEAQKLCAPYLVK